MDKSNTPCKTTTLMKNLVQANSLDSFLDRNKSSFYVPAFSDYVQSLCDERRLPAERVIKAADIDRTYGHQLFNGTRQPSRDNVLKLALAFGLDIDRTQRLLRIAGKAALYPRIERDAILIFAIGRGYRVQKVQELLFEHGLSLLGKNNSYESLSSAPDSSI